MTTLLMTEDGGPRVRRADPLESHIAADASQHTLHQIKDAVLELVFEIGLPTGKQINAKYAAVQESRGYPVADWDSPRKRAGELVADGLLERLSNPDGRGAFYIVNLNGFNRLGAEK